MIWDINSYVVLDSEAIPYLVQIALIRMGEDAGAES